MGHALRPGAELEIPTAALRWNFWNSLNKFVSSQLTALLRNSVGRSEPAELCPCLLQPLPGNPPGSLSLCCAMDRPLWGFLLLLPWFHPVSAHVRMLLVRWVWFQLNPLLSFESPHSAAQLIPRDEAGRNFPGSHRFPPFSAELIHLPHPHINTPHPGWTVSIPTTDPLQETISIQGWKPPTTNFVTFTIPVLSPIPPGGSQKQCGAGINPGHGARASSTWRQQPSRSNVIPWLIQCRLFTWSRVSPNLHRVVKWEQSKHSLQWWGVNAKAMVKPKGAFGVGKGQAGAWQDWRRWSLCWAGRASSEPSWESQTTRDSSSAVIHLHLDHHTKQPFLHGDLKAVHEELLVLPPECPRNLSCMKTGYLQLARAKLSERKIYYFFNKQT